MMSMPQVPIFQSILILGDIATFPYPQQDGKDLRIEHWDVAINHGRTVANHIVKGDEFEGTFLFCYQPCNARLHFHGVLLVRARSSDALLWHHRYSRI